MAGHHQYRPDLSYPESHSDMSAAVRALLRMYEVKRRPIALDTQDMLQPEPTCDVCEKEATFFKSEVKMCYTHGKERGM